MLNWAGGGVGERESSYRARWRGLAVLLPSSSDESSRERFVEVEPREEEGEGERKGEPRVRGGLFSSMARALLL
jgi:hypothetical protein